MGHGHDHSEAYRAEIFVDGDDVHVGTNLAKADPCLHEPILGAIAAHLGYTMEPLAKASKELDPDPRYPELVKLIRGEDGRRTVV